MELAENAISQSSTDPGIESSLARARVRSAFISLKRFDLHRARELLVRGRADPREVICLYPRLLPASSNFTRSVRALNDIADVNQIAKNDASKLSALDTFLIDYLEYIRASEGDNFVHKHVSFFFNQKLFSEINFRDSFFAPSFIQSFCPSSNNLRKSLRKLQNEQQIVLILSISECLIIRKMFTICQQVEFIS